MTKISQMQDLVYLDFSNAKAMTTKNDHLRMLQNIFSYRLLILRSVGN
jgi:hypothetical protein